MPIEKNQLKNLIVDILKKIDMDSPSATNLLMGTAAQESRLGTYIKQLGSGPALGIFQMEPDTEKDIWNNYIYYRVKIVQKVYDVAYVSSPNSLHLMGNLIYQIIMARIHYRRRSEPLPKHDDIEGLANYWKNYYNTIKGKGTVEEFVENYNRYIKEV